MLSAHALGLRAKRSACSLSAAAAAFSAAAAARSASNSSLPPMGHRWARLKVVLSLLVQCGSIAGGGTPAALTALQSAKGLSEASLA
jgi:hypothetical protein